MRRTPTSRRARAVRRVLAGGFPLLVVLATAAVVRAEVDKQASELFRAGEASYARGDFPSAARSFEEAHRRAPHAATLYNAGLAWEWAQQFARAADDYEVALKLGGLSPMQTAGATTRLAVLEKNLGHVRVVEPRGGIVSVAHLERATAPVVVHVAPGDHEVRIFRSGGQSEASRVSVAAGATTEVAFAAEPVAPALSATESLANREAATTAPGRRRPWGLAALGTSVGLGGMAIYFGVQALDARDAYNRSGYTDLNAYNRASTLRTWTNVFWVGAGLAAAAGAVLILGDGGHDAGGAPNPPRAAISLAPGGALFSARF
jgi:hypothetical protein